MRITRLVTYVFVIILLGACSTPKNITYFKDAVNGQTLSVLESQQIKLQPEDKISIVVNSKDDQLMELVNLPIVSYRIGTGALTRSQSQQISVYTVDSKGQIDFPYLGKLKVSGLSRQEVVELVKDQLMKKNLIKDPVVTVEYANLAVSVLGEVKDPGRFSLDKDRTSLLDVLGMAGDLTIYGKRENVKVVRSENGEQQTYIVNLNSDSSLVKSPVYYLQQNDVVYVEPNNMRARQATVNGNNVVSTSFWISIASLLTSVAVLIFK